MLTVGVPVPPPPVLLQTVPFSVNAVGTAYVPFQPELTFWLPGKAKPSVQLVTGELLLVIPMLTVAPVPQSFWMVYCTTQAGVAAFVTAAQVRLPATSVATAPTRNSLESFMRARSSSEGLTRPWERSHR